MKRCAYSPLALGSFVCYNAAVMLAEILWERTCTFFPYVDITSKIWPPRRHGVTSLAREGDIWGALKKNVFILPISVVCYGMAIGLIRPEGYKLYSSSGV